MKGLILQVSALAFSALLVGCGSKTEEAPSNKYPTQSQADADTKMSGALVECRDSKLCHPSVGMLITKGLGDKPEIALCSGSLVAPDVFMTNSHCLPADLTTGVSCYGRAVVEFPGMGQYSDVRITCDSVIANSGFDTSESLSLIGQDYAFLKLKSAVERPVLPVSHAGFADEATFSIYKINPTADRKLPLGLMTKDTCKAVQGSQILPRFLEPLFPLFSTGDCRVVHGNSGSPLLDGEGRAHGIIQAGIEPEKIEKSKLKLPLEGPINGVSIGTNLACVKLPDEASFLPLPEVCKFKPGESPDLTPAEKKRELELFFDRLGKKLDPYVLTYEKSQSGLNRESFAYGLGAMKPESALLASLVNQPSGHLFAFAKPECFKSRHLSVFKSDEVQGRLPLALKMSYLPKIWQLDFSYNIYLQPSGTVNAAVLDNLSGEVEFSPKDLIENGSAKMKVQFRKVGGTSGNPSETVFEDQIPVCAESIVGVPANLR